MNYTVAYMEQSYLTEKIRLFVKVVQQGSFTRAAAHLKMPKSTVSRAIRDLEKAYSTKLLVRTTRHLAMTAAGRGFFDACVGPIQTLEDAARSLAGQDSIVAGSINITAPEDLGQAVVVPVAAELSRHHRDLRLNIHLSNEVVDMVRDGFDLAVRIGKLSQSSFRAIRVGNINLILVASPQYLENKSFPDEPKALNDHRLLSLELEGLRSRWHLSSGRKRMDLDFHPALTANHMSSLLDLASMGAGIALIPSYLGHPLCVSGKLIHVLPGWAHTSYPVHVVSPLEIGKTARLRECADRLVAALRRALEPV